MHDEQSSHDGLDQSRDVLAWQARSATTDLNISGTDRETLRGLAGRVAELAVRPIEAQKQQTWVNHNALRPTRPVVFCDPERGWNEIIAADELECTNELARQWEMHLRKEIFWGSQMNDDYTIRPYFDISHVHGDIDWGLTETRIGGGDGGAYTWDAPIKTERDVEQLRFPQIDVDHEATERLLGTAEHVFGDLLNVRAKTQWWWTLGLTRTLVELRGLQQVMFDVYDNPELVHLIMSVFRDGTLAMLDGLESDGLLSDNSEGTYVGSGGLGWSDELGSVDADATTTCRDMWGFAESQETVGISPAMFAEFVFPYQEPILERFGLNCYGCCEPLDKRWHIVRQIPNLRRVSVSAWADMGLMAEQLQDNYIYSWKPNPADLAMSDFDEDHIRSGLREMLQITKGCHVEIIMKDNHTIRNEPHRVVRWVQIVREEIDRA